MDDETAHRSSEVRDAGGGVEGGVGSESPLQTRAAFLANWDWESVVRLNRGVCARGGAQHGENSGSHQKVAADWRERFQVEGFTLGETLDFLRGCHRAAPFLFFNGNTFADIGRTFSDFLFAELPTSRRRNATSAVAHYIAGVLDRESMVQILEALCRATDFSPGDKVRTLKGSLHGTVLAVLDDGRLKWQTEVGTVLIALPESLLPATEDSPDTQGP